MLFVDAGMDLRKKGNVKRLPTTKVSTALYNSLNGYLSIGLGDVSCNWIAIKTTSILYVAIDWISASNDYKLMEKK